MYSANGFCFLRECPLLIVKKKKDKIHVFPPLFHNIEIPKSRIGRRDCPHHVWASRRGRSSCDQTLLLLLSKGKWAASAAVISCSPSKQETSLELQTYLLHCITKLIVLPGPCYIRRWRSLWRAAEQLAFASRKGYYLVQLFSIP